jgi:hypothetical protein
VNDAWNVAEVELGSGLGPRLLGIASRLRLFRLGSVWLHDRELERGFAALAGDGVWRVQPTRADPADFHSTHTLDWGGVVEKMDFDEQEGWGSEAEVEARIERNFAAMAAYARSAGIRLIVISYPLGFSRFAPVNRALGRLAERGTIELVVTTPAMERVPPEQRNFVAAHPGAAVYREIARDVSERVLRPPPR